MKLNRKTIVLLASFVLLFVFVIGSTLAWIADTSDPVVNSFEPTEVTCEIIENNFDKKVKNDVTVKNTSKDVTAFIRAAIIVNWQDENGYLTPAVAGDYTLTIGSDWKENGNYYYYNSKVEPGEFTGNLVKLCKPAVVKDGMHLRVEIIADAIQAEPISAVTDAWGVDPTALS